MEKRLVELNIEMTWPVRGLTDWDETIARRNGSVKAYRCWPRVPVFSSLRDWPTFTKTSFRLSSFLLARKDSDKISSNRNITVNIMLQGTKREKFFPQKVRVNIYISSQRVHIDSLPLRIEIMVFPTAEMVNIFPRAVLINNYVIQGTLRSKNIFIPKDECKGMEIKLNLHS